MQTNSKIALCSLAQNKKAKLALIFAGQANDYITELRSMWQRYAVIKTLVHEVETVLVKEIQTPQMVLSGYYTQGLDICSWLQNESKLPSSEYLFSSPVSQPLVLLTQISHYLSICVEGYSSDEVENWAMATTGHSQGIVASIIAAMGLPIEEVIKETVVAARYLLWQGFRMQESHDFIASEELSKEAIKELGATPKCMVSIQGFTSDELQKILDFFNSNNKKKDYVYLSLDNESMRKVLSGSPDSLEKLRLYFKNEYPKKNAYPLRNIRFTYLNTSAPFHSPHMDDCVSPLLDDIARLGWKVDPTKLKIPIYSPFTGEDLRFNSDFTKEVVEIQSIRPVFWKKALLPLYEKHNVTHVLDLGPGVGIAKLVSSYMIGFGVQVFAIANPEERQIATTHDAKKIPFLDSWQQYLPKIINENGQNKFVNAFTEFSGRSPVILPGMTPITVTADIVVATANAGFLAELAGGGQVTENMFRERMKEIQEKLSPEQGVVLNTLYLDPYLWNLQIRQQQMLFKLKEEGFPFIGITVSAGLPPVEEAVPLLHKLHEYGMFLNAFKAGTNEQIQQVLNIADACPEYTICLHVEGGLAGGHHGWNDLRHVLIQNYKSIRERKNVLLLVGGGIREEQDAIDFVMGTWNKEFELPVMPMDGVFLGTLAMACLESEVSDDCKKALVKAKGTKSWTTFLATGEVKGEITSSKSPLDADIYYLENTASKLGRLLDTLVGNKEGIIRNRGKIIELLNQTARPYFGDLETMTYLRVLQSMVDFMARGTSNRYEDGRWIDITYRLRFAKMLARTLDRFSLSETLVFSDEDMQKPEQVLQQLSNSCEHVAKVPLAPEDQAFFIYQVCQIPGKPVNFVPVIDESIRKWYKGDSLHTCNDARFSADQVFQTPGPRAVGGISKINEPVADLFERFHQALVKNTLAKDENVENQDIHSEYILEEHNVNLKSLVYWSKYKGKIATLLQAPCIVRNNNVIRNFVHTLLALKENTRLVLQTKGNDLLSIMLEEKKNSAWSCLFTLSIENDKVCLKINHSLTTMDGERTCHFTTYFEHHCEKMPPYNISEVNDGRVERIANFYSSLLLDNPEKTDKTEATTTFVLKKEHVRRYISSVNGIDSQFKTAPLSMAFVIAWQPLFQILLHPDCVGDFFTLVHLANRITRLDAKGLTTNTTYNVHAALKSVSYGKEGKKVVVVAQISSGETAVVVLESEFLLREKVDSKLLGTSKSFATPFSYPQSVEKNLETPYYSYEKSLMSPKTGDTYALVSRDFNPLHRDSIIANIAGFANPIVHGMWSKGTALQTFRQKENIRHRDVSRIETMFSSPAVHNEKLSTYARHIAMNQGQKVYEIYCAIEKDGQRVPTVTGKICVDAPSVAMIFPGQGIQEKGMGMDGYRNSPAARKIWDRADEVTKETFGFSILQVVQENPNQLRVRNDVLRHEKGVLFLTQFTQVALVVHAIASIEELKESSVYVPNHYFCGHSIGEYSAISACSGVLSLDKVIKVVYQRGLTMQNFVPRNEKGKSSYRMGVIAPYRAKMKEKEALDLVKEIQQKTGKTIEVVNYNVRGRQYAIAGHIESLDVLKSKLAHLATDPSKPVYMDIPGLDVPFHSTVLKDGVNHFREVLKKTIPADNDFSHLEERYIPNLVAKPFTVSKDFCQDILNITDSPVMREVVNDFDVQVQDRNNCARKILIELLAYQFAFPVRWIETQDILLENKKIDMVWEIGVGYQPTLSNMLGQTMMGSGQQKPVYNVERDRNIIYFLGKEFELPPIDNIEKDTSVATEKITPVEREEKIETVHAKTEVSTGTAAPPETSAVKHALFSILALQTKIWPEEMQDGETIDQLLGGNSSRRNQSVVDIWSEFNIAPIDGAHEIPLSQLEETIRGAVGNRYNAPGAYLKVAHTEAMKRIFAKVGNITLRDVMSFLKANWDIDDATIFQVLSTIAVTEAIDVSSRGNLKSPINKNINSKKDAHTFIENVLQHYHSVYGWHFARKTSQSSGEKMDSAALDKVLSQYFGATGAFAEIARFTQSALGQDPYAVFIDREKEFLDDANALLYDSEHGPRYLQTIMPRFSAKKIRSFSSVWNWTRSKITELYWNLKNKRCESLPDHVLFSVLANPISEVKTLIAGIKEKAQKDNELHIVNIFEELEKSLQANGMKRLLQVQPTAPYLEIGTKGILFEEKERKGEESLADFVQKSTANVLAKYEEICKETNKVYFDALGKQVTEGVSFTNKVALVTGAGQGAIATSIVQNLLRGGATVIITTTKANLERTIYYKKIYKEYAGQGAELYICPFNQGSTKDIQDLLNWIYTAQDGRPAWQLDYFIPFGAVPEENNLLTLDDNSLSTLRVMLFGVEYMIGQIAKRTLLATDTSRKVQVLLPLSPNHGQFGNDGFYAETKIGLEALLNKWKSEYDAWGKVCSIIGAKIGWVRGTGLMSANDIIAAELEAQRNIRTYSCDEMAFLLTGLLDENMASITCQTPIIADFMGGMDKVADLSSIVTTIRRDIETKILENKALETEKRTTKNRVLPLSLELFPNIPKPERLESLTSPKASLHDTIVIVGYGEVGTFGNAEIRWDQEHLGKLSETRALELARIIGLVEFSISQRYVGWVDIATGEPVDEITVGKKYEKELMAAVGIREMSKEHARFDPNHFEIYSEVPLENEVRFRVDDKKTAQSYHAANPERIEYYYDKEQDCYVVLLRKATKIRVPKKATFTRTVAGQVPAGWHPHRFGLPNEMCQQLDFNTQHSLIGTAEAFVNSGIEPEELYKYIHPAKVGNTLGSGLGGGQSLSHLARDFVLDQPRQGDRIQETLVNVMGAYNIQNYIGSYGTVASPANACATAAISVEIGMEKILAGKADFIVAGSYDDLTDTGVLGFKDMNATANTNDLKERGFTAPEMSRPNDIMRSGFVEGQGGGTILLCRGSVAVEAGLPVYGIVAMATSATDGVNLSIPAPGLGLLSVGSESSKHKSPLREALTKYGLTVDDLAVVSKHDTSTLANDKNESELYHLLMTQLGRIQGLPLMVISQKSLTGHSKGGAAAWQLNGLLQTMASGVVPGNHNLLDVDKSLRRHTFLNYNDSSVNLGSDNIKAGLITSLGFGHVGAMMCVLHPDIFFKMIPVEEYGNYVKMRQKRWEHRYQKERNFLIGKEVLFQLRDKKPYSDDEERSMLFSPDFKQK